MEKKKLEELNLLDDFLINRVMCDPDFGKDFAKIILHTIFGREMGKLLVIPQKVEYGEDTGRHGIRLDVYIDSDEDGIFDVELDKTEHKLERESLPKRVRFYHSKIDVGILASGSGYDKLRNVCVIFVVNYDPFGLNRMVYTVKNVCREEPDMPYDDGASTIFLYTKGIVGNPPKELQQLLHYMEDTSEMNANSEELKQVHKMVELVKHKRETEMSYMQLYEFVNQEKRIAAREAMAQGVKQGISESVLLFLEEKGNVPDDLRAKIESEHSEDKLKQWLKQAAGTESIEKFRQSMYL